MNRVVLTHNSFQWRCSGRWGSTVSKNRSHNVLSSIMELCMVAMYIFPSLNHEIPICAVLVVKVTWGRYTGNTGLYQPKQTIPLPFPFVDLEAVAFFGSLRKIVFAMWVFPSLYLILLKKWRQKKTPLILFHHYPSHACQNRDAHPVIYSLVWFSLEGFRNNHNKCRLTYFNISS